MNRRLVASWILLVASGGALGAQRGLPPVDIMGIEPLGFGEVVHGAPYSAEAATEMTQELRDGNRIEQRSTITIARDATGRTRREQSCWRSAFRRRSACSSAFCRRDAPPNSTRSRHCRTSDHQAGRWSSVAKM